MFKRAKILIFILLTAICCLPSSPLAAANVKIVGRQMFVDGKPFTVKGVNYGYTPVGSGYSTYDESIHPEFYKADFALIRAMGANTLRLHDLPTDDKMLDAAYEYGLYVIITIPVSWSDDLSTEAGRNTVLSSVTTYVTRWKDHPAILMWCVGNEINYWNIVAYDSTPRLSDWYILLNDCARTAHEIEGANYHPVTTAESEIANLGTVRNGSDDASMPDLDLWAVQVYRGNKAGFATMFTDCQTKSAKPFVITEFGCDAYNTITQAEDQTAQADCIQGMLDTLHLNLSADSPDRAFVGGCLFQWADDWSKNQWGAANSTHDTSATWSSPNYYDFVDSNTNNMNEEWWGLCAISPGTDTKTLRPAYYRVQDKWAPNTQGTAASSNVFASGITNYPNPFNPDSGSTTIAFTVAPGTAVKVKIYDIAGRLVKVLKEETIDTYAQYQVVWDGKDDANTIVANGVYICFVEANGTQGTDVKYRKILALK
ncbi:MAG: glycoside hydrolase family 2 TIM barrel-domain containing protein [bacterium]|nr:glycoside hydrolase family 2 TIM barrel-domain containing protein [bacterium]MDD5353560.1 glycoside hydrolase family 2 TIM barrel-domain containing protein [bacterium]